MKKLLKEYRFNSDMQYFEMIIESFLNGNIKQSQEQFKAMPKADKKAFIKSSILYWNMGVTKENIFNYFFILL